MNSEEIKATIERLDALVRDNVPSVRDVADAFVGTNGYGLRNMLIDLLKQADPESHVELPRDVDGEYVHVGDRMVLADGGEPFEVLAIGGNALWFMDEDLQETHDWASYECRHYKPTVGDVLRRFAGEWFIAMGDSRCEAKIIEKYAARIAEATGTTEHGIEGNDGS